MVPLASFEDDGIFPWWVGEKPMFLRNKTCMVMLVLIFIRGEDKKLDWGKQKIEESPTIRLTFNY